VNPGKTRKNSSVSIYGGISHLVSKRKPTYSLSNRKHILQIKHRGSRSHWPKRKWSHPAGLQTKISVIPWGNLSTIILYSYSCPCA
jgi:hypothetical protein